MTMRITRRQALSGLTGAVTLAMYPAAAEDRLAQFYRRALVIDGLSFGKEWKDGEFAALRDAGYSGIVESLPRQDLQTAIEALVAWRRRAAEHPETTLDGILFSKGPVAMTHTMCEALRHNHPRAKTDEQIRACAGKGGVVGIAALGYFLGPDPGGETTIEHYADHIEHAVSVAGEEHVALSSDFPPQGIEPWATKENWYEPRLKSFKPSYEVRWPPWIPELDSTERFLNTTRVLARRGWTERRLELLLHDGGSCVRGRLLNGGFFCHNTGPFQSDRLVMTRGFERLRFVLIYLFLVTSPGSHAQSTASAPVPLFLQADLPAGVPDTAERILMSYPDATRHRIVTVNKEVISHVFGELPKSERASSSATGILLVDVDDAAGVGTEIILNFFDDRTFETVVDKSAAHSQQGTHYSLQLKEKGQPATERFIDVGLAKPTFGEESIFLHYGSGYKYSSYYSIRALPGTPYHVVIERNRGRNSYRGTILMPAVSARDQLPVRIDGGIPGVSAEMGPIIDYGLADFSFGDDEIGYAISGSAAAGHPPRAFKTIDGGKTWNSLRVEPNWVPTGIHFRSRHEGYLSLRFNPVGHSIQNICGCGLLRTTDGGSSWERLQDGGVDYCLHHLRFSEEGTGYAIGWDQAARVGWLWRSTDDGKRWSRWIELPRAPAYIDRIELFGDEIVLVPHLGLGSAGCGILTLDQLGRFKSPICLSYPEVKQLRFVSRDIMFANVSDELGKYLLRTVDGGQTWRRIFEGQFSIIYTRSAREIGMVLKKGETSASDVASRVSAFSYTVDGGNSWMEGPAIHLSSYIRDDVQRLGDGTELTLLGDNLLRVGPR